MRLLVTVLALVAAAGKGPREEPATGHRRSQLARSALVCSYRYWRSQTRKEIATEQHYSDIGGAANLSKLYLWQQLLRQLDEEEGRVRADLAREKTDLLRCTHAAVSRYAGCNKAGIMERTRRLDVTVKDGCEVDEVLELALLASPKG